MKETQNPIETENKWLADKQARDARTNRIAEIRSQFRENEAELKRLRSVSPQAQVVLDLWLGNAEYHVANLTNQLSSRAAEGKTPAINLTSPELLSFLLLELMREKLPALAATVVGSQNISSSDIITQRHIIEDEQLHLRLEHAALGGVGL